MQCEKELAVNMAAHNVADLFADLNLDALEIEEPEPVTQETLVMRMGIPVGEPGALHIKVVDRGRSHNLERINPLSSVDSWSLSHLGYLYPGITPVMIKLDHNRSCPWV